MDQKIKAGSNGDHYVPYAERSGNESIVYFTRDLSAAGLEKIYKRICSVLFSITQHWFCSFFLCFGVIVVGNTITT